jgi:uncharacterized protein (TIGR03086 family)
VPPIADLHARAGAWFGDHLAPLTMLDLKRATPCTEWSVGDLLDHVVSENLWVPQLLAGRTIEEVGDRFEGDVLGDDPVGAFERSFEAADSAIRATPADRPVAVSYGPVPARVYDEHRFLDLLVHGWDLAMGLERDATMPPDLVDACLAVVEGQRELIEGSGVFRTDVPVPDGPPQSRLLALLGRRG